MVSLLNLSALLMCNSEVNFGLKLQSNGNRNVLGWV